MGYDPKNWSVEKLEFSSWQQHTKEQTTKQLYAIKVRLKPKKYEPTKEEYVQAIKELLKEEVKPLVSPKQPKIVGLNKELMMFLPPVELHYGKVAWEEISQEYNSEIAEERFIKIHEDLILEQRYRKCNKLYYPIGNDFS
jgi:hypothetical protein